MKTYSQLRNRTLCFFAMFLLGVSSAWTQQNTTLTGTVLNDKNEQLAGVTIIVAGVTAKENYTTISDEDGVFNFRNLIAGTTYNFSVSYIGYETVSIKKYLVKQGKNNILSIKLKPANSALNEVVVTALGIKREEKSLGYAAQSVGEAAVKDAKTNKWINSLSGKVAD